MSNEAPIITHEFEVGKTYRIGWASWSDANDFATVVKRTAKFVTLRMKHGDETRRKVHEFRGVEVCEPYGQYSMNPVCHADQPIEREAA